MQTQLQRVKKIWGVKTVIDECALLYYTPSRNYRVILKDKWLSQSKLQVNYLSKFENMKSSAVL